MIVYSIDLSVVRKIYLLCAFCTQGLSNNEQTFNSAIIPISSYFVKNLADIISRSTLDN